ncbi:hypothetical protein LLH03_15295, partial [bacterium]|nr:hypothetical protein [bacterium]
MRRLAWVACLLALPLGPALAQQKPVQPGPSLGMELTVYNIRLALVKDLRTLSLTKGLNEVEFTDIPSELEPTSVHLRSLTAPDAVVLREQSFRDGVADDPMILDSYFGGPVTVRRAEGNAPPTVITGELLSFDGFGDIVTVKTADKIVVCKLGALELPLAPDGLTTRPTLNWSVESSQAATHKVEVSYLTNQVMWSADYVAIVNADDSLADLKAWVTVSNHSGATFPNTRLKLVAGDVQRLEPPRPPAQTLGTPQGELQAIMAGEPPVKLKAFFEYHLYTLARPTTVRDNESKQIEFLTTTNIPVKKLYLFDGQDQKLDYEGRGKCRVKVELINSRQNNLGVPLPKGKVRVYKADDDQSHQFVGEDVIDHTPKDEKVRLYVGNAFDVVGERHELDRKQLDENTYESAVEVKLRNHKTQDITVACVEHASGDWQILKESMPSTKKDAQTFEYSVPVPK